MVQAVYRLLGLSSLLISVLEHRICFLPFVYYGPNPKSECKDGMDARELDF